jgi:O-acetyl-ADP-ribose deacetylase (regulator of RNase III)
MKLISTKDGKNWQAAYTSENRYKNGSSAKDPALAATIRQALEQYVSDAPGTNKAPDNIAGVVLNPEKNPLFLTREMIASILKVEARVQRASRSGILVTKGDITKMKADCIVNAANCSLLGGGGVDGAIHRAAGPGLLEECRKLDGCHTGEAKITGGYDLPAKYVIHTVGPIYDGDEDDPKLLASCYRNSLDLAMKNNAHSIIFPNISTGGYGYPKEEAAEIAMGAVGRWLSDHKGYVMHVVMCCFDQENYEIYEKLVKMRQNKDQKV